MAPVLKAAKLSITKQDKDLAIAYVENTLTQTFGTKEIIDENGNKIKFEIKVSKESGVKLNDYVFTVSANVKKKILKQGDKMANYLKEKNLKFSPTGIMKEWNYDYIFGISNGYWIDANKKELSVRGISEVEIDWDWNTEAYSVKTGCASTSKKIN